MLGTSITINKKAYMIAPVVLPANIEKMMVKQAVLLFTFNFPTCCFYYLLLTTTSY